ncbi:MAG: pseudoazurin [Roseobacter sp. MedPE-SW]|nr:MAG: pseudoazurin [Roseobacter sp. MedPE-SW]
MRSILSFFLLVIPSLALSETYEVQMLNRNANGSMVYDPPYLNIQAGDSIKFVATRPGHNAASIKGMIPDGATAIKGRLNEEITVTLNVEGLYGIKCTPHFDMGMVMLIEVGAQRARAEDLPDGLPERAAARLHSYLAEKN